MSAAPRRVAIIGAGPGGCAAAFYLARLDAASHITLFERAEFPRVKVCGEFVSPAATNLLESIVPQDELIAAGARKAGTMSLISLDRHGRERRREWPLPRSAWALSRASLDSLLLEKCRAAGVHVVQPAAVQSVAYADNGVSIRLADGRTHDADLVVHADGSGRHDPAGPVPSDARSMGHKCHFRTPPGLLRGIEMRACPGAYVGTIEVEHGLATCALAADKQLIRRFDGDADAMVRHLWPRYEPAWRRGEWKSSGIARSSFIRPGHPRSFRVGNAAGAVDPVGGEGIGLALWGGATLARLLATHDAGDASDLFARACRARLRTRRWSCRAVAAMLVRPTLVRTLWPLLAVPSLTIRPWNVLSGKAG